MASGSDTAMDQVIRSCENYEIYPQNIMGQNASIHRAKAYLDKLRGEEDRLFDAKQAKVDVLDIDRKTQKYPSETISKETTLKAAPWSDHIQTRFVTSLNEVRKFLRTVFDQSQVQPECRFLFIHALHSRAPLRISREMLTFLFSYYQVPPSFLDFIFPFGRQEYAQNYYFGAIREESRLYEKQRGPAIPQWGRSGRDIRICYNLRSVERSPGQIQLEWSVRQTAVYHSLDVETGQTLWINIKGNLVLKNRVLEAESLSESSPAASTRRPFSSSLETHILFAEWAGENWRWYINELENELQKLTKRTIVAPIPKVHMPTSAPEHYGDRPSEFGSASIGPYSRSDTLVASETSRASAKGPSDDRGWPRSKLSRGQRLLKRFSGQLSPDSASSKFRDSGSYERYPPSGQVDTRIQPPELPPEFEMTPAGGLSSLNELDQEGLLGSFSFRDLQSVHHIEEKIDEAKIALSSNAGTLDDLRHFYHSITKHGNFPAIDMRESEEDIMLFDERIESIQKDLHMQGLRAKTLLDLLQGRKALLNSILQYRSMKAGEFFAKKAQQSTGSMETITSRMHEIAIKTKQETVSMRIITLVTLFFLPGTFVATFMSTDVLRFTDAQRIFQPEALRTYLAISLPMMAVAFTAWYLLYRFSRHRENVRGVRELAYV